MDLASEVRDDNLKVGGGEPLPHLSRQAPHGACITIDSCDVGTVGEKIRQR